MCILFINTNPKDGDGDYSMILATNRDEFYDRPASAMAPWDGDPDVFGGRDVQAGGTWLAVSPRRKKIGVLLNIPGYDVEHTKSRGTIVADFAKSDLNTEDYVALMDSYIKDCSGFILVTADFEKSTPTVETYCNVQKELITHHEDYVGFGNSFPMKPLQKVEAGKEKFKDICTTFNKLEKKEQLINRLFTLLKSDERHLPDPQLEERQPQLYKELSSIFVHVPSIRYGTRTHTIMLVTKTGHIDVIEATLVAPIDIEIPIWEVSKYEFNL